MDKLSRYIEASLMLVRGIIFQIIHLKFDGLLLIGKGVDIYGIKNIHFTGRLVVWKYSTIDARFSKGIYFGRNCSIGQNSIIRSSGSSKFIAETIKIGENTSFGPFCNVGGGFGLKIGKNNIIGPYCSIHPESHIYENKNILIKDQGISGVGVEIGSNNWIGAKVCILDGSIINNNCIIAACAVVTKGEHPSNSLVKGIPARSIQIKFSHEKK